MGLMAIIGSLYGLHVKRNAEHMAAWTYVAGSIGAIYAGDLLTLFLFWEVMAFSSVFLIWFRGRRSRSAPATAICWSTWRAACPCSRASCCTTRHGQPGLRPVRR
ncbi:MAG: hypothetical protein IPN11_07655 [Opitutaceae bacterium]|nr:hypothetical protein [Opitutaceae bacterium]